MREWMSLLHPQPQVWQQQRDSRQEGRGDHPEDSGVRLAQCFVSAKRPLPVGTLLASISSGAPGLAGFSYLLMMSLRARSSWERRATERTRNEAAPRSTAPPTLSTM